MRKKVTRDDNVPVELGDSELHCFTRVEVEEQQKIYGAKGGS